jgi:hypothetical protein
LHSCMWSAGCDIVISVETDWIGLVRNSSS